MPSKVKWHALISRHLIVLFFRQSLLLSTTIQLKRPCYRKSHHVHTLQKLRITDTYTTLAMFMQFSRNKQIETHLDSYCNGCSGAEEFSQSQRPTTITTSTNRKHRYPSACAKRNYMAHEHPRVHIHRYNDCLMEFLRIRKEKRQQNKRAPPK